MKKIYIALTLILGLSACQAVDNTLSQISEDTGGLVNIYTPTTLKARREALIHQALITQESVSWDLNSNYCPLGKCYVTIRVSSVAYNSGEAYSLDMSVRDNIDGKNRKYERRKYVKGPNGWSLLQKY